MPLNTPRVHVLQLDERLLFHLFQFHVPLLKQGTLSKAAPGSADARNDTVVTKVGLTEEQKQMRKNLANR